MFTYYHATIIQLLLILTQLSIMFILFTLFTVITGFTALSIISLEYLLFNRASLSEGIGCIDNPQALIKVTPNP